MRTGSAVAARALPMGFAKFINCVQFWFSKVGRKPKIQDSPRLKGSGLASVRYVTIAGANTRWVHQRVWFSRWSMLVALTDGAQIFGIRMRRCVEVPHRCWSHIDGSLKLSVADSWGLFKRGSGGFLYDRLREIWVGDR